MRTALIGYGLGGAAFHAPFIATTPGLTLSAVVTGNPERRAEVRARYPDTALLDAPDDVWRQAADFDLVVVTTPNRYHASHARSALEHDLDAVVDKPFAGGVAEAKALATLAETRGRRLVPFHNRRWDGDFRTVRRLLAEGVLGDVHRFESRFERWRPEVKDSWKESGDPADLGGIVHDLGTHLIDQAVALFGRPRTVYAEVRALREHARAHDDAFLALTHDNGVVSHLWMSALAEDQGPRFRVLGNRAAYVKHGMDPQEERLKAGVTPGGPSWGIERPDAWGTVSGTPTPTEPGAYQTFYATIAAGRTPVTAQDAITGLEVVEAAFASAATGTTVSLAN
ncbi:Gfo/Idh/MocA family oxidoreductase [Actinosynnema sp. NPDC047251]|uniref:Putative oxidoreductase n=1 Tax=Saccharothrix espanaensis (strain ATCC 51144 / DSM 44229 / JCM 9112 / NBRC 15066 / NRRL 15764) TaxID=1179773 RepID=K0K8M9_SACES|nr:Gfo/Idh/MocA family oxidoreductase [Saccharothrix espanaensis]CCH34736.1 putative oxidoreductase [Saccharothrix espanaensis DSM 44229]